MDVKTQVSRGNQIFALLIAAIAISDVFLDPGVHSYLLLGSCLLFAWLFAFTPMPRLGMSMRSVYQTARKGHWRMPISSKLVTLLAIILFVASFASQFS